MIKAIRVTSAEVVKAVCDHYNVPVNLVKSEDRSHALTRIRYVIARVLNDKDKMAFSLPRTGRALGKSHSTVIYWLAKGMESGNAPTQREFDAIDTVWSKLLGG